MNTEDNILIPIDFNKITNMPESFNLISRSVKYHAIGAYFTAVNPYAYDLGIPKMEESIFSTLYEKICGILNVCMIDKYMPRENIIVSKILGQSEKDIINLGKIYVEIFINYDVTSKYE